MQARLWRAALGARECSRAAGPKRRPRRRSPHRSKARRCPCLAHRWPPRARLATPLRRWRRRWRATPCGPNSPRRAAQAAAHPAASTHTSRPLRRWRQAAARSLRPVETRPPRRGSVSAGATQVALRPTRRPASHHRARCGRRSANRCAPHPGSHARTRCRRSEAAARARPRCPHRPPAAGRRTHGRSAHSRPARPGIGNIRCPWVLGRSLRLGWARIAVRRRRQALHAARPGTIA